MKEIKLKDLYFVAFLLNEGQPLIRVENDGAKLWFVFEDSQKIIDLQNSFWYGNALTNARSYVEKIQTLKNRIFNGN